MDQTGHHHKGLSRGVITGAVVIASVIAHSVVLTLPFPDPSSDDAPTATQRPDQPSEPEDISVVSLPSIEKAATLPAKETAPAPNLEGVSPAPTPEPPEPLLQTTVTSDKAIAAPVPEPQPLNPTPTPTPDQPTTDTSTLSDQASDQPAIAEDPPTVPEEPPVGQTQPDTFSPSPTGPLVTYDEAFPHPDEAIAGCFGLMDCRRVEGAGTYRSVARSVVENLEATGYVVRLRDDLDDTGRNVYELSPPQANGQTQYLIVFSDFDGAAVYVMSTEILTLRDLQSLQAQSEYSRAMGDV